MTIIYHLIALKSKQEFQTDLRMQLEKQFHEKVVEKDLESKRAIEDRERQLEEEAEKTLAARTKEIRDEIDRDPKFCSSTV